jgi:hypothetical protein
MPTGEQTAASTVCAGCDTRIPGEVGTVPHADGTCYGEWLKTPLGLTYVRTCWTRACVLEARRRREGRRTTPPQPRDTVDTAALGN